MVGAEGSQVMLVGEPLGGWSDMQPMEAMADGGGHELTLLLPKARFFFFFFFLFHSKAAAFEPNVGSSNFHRTARVCACLRLLGCSRARGYPERCPAAWVWVWIWKAGLRSGWRKRPALEPGRK